MGDTNSKTVSICKIEKACSKRCCVLKTLHTTAFFKVLQQRTLTQDSKTTTDLILKIISHLVLITKQHLICKALLKALQLTVQTETKE